MHNTQCPKSSEPTLPSTTSACLGYFSFPPGTSACKSMSQSTQLPQASPHKICAVIIEWISIMTECGSMSAASTELRATREKKIGEFGRSTGFLSQRRADFHRVQDVYLSLVKFGTLEADPKTCIGLRKLAKALEFKRLQTVRLGQLSHSENQN